METWSIMRHGFPCWAMKHEWRVASSQRDYDYSLLPFPSNRRARLDQLVDDRIHQRLERRVDDVGGDADRGPALAGLVLALDQHARYRLGAAVENAHPIVGEIEGIDIFLILAEVLAQCEVERVDRAVALRGRDHAVSVDRHLHHRHGDGHALAFGADPLLDVD